MGPYSYWIERFPSFGMALSISLCLFVNCAPTTDPKSSSDDCSNREDCYLKAKSAYAASKYTDALSFTSKAINFRKGDTDTLAECYYISGKAHYNTAGSGPKPDSTEMAAAIQDFENALKIKKKAEYFGSLGKAYYTKGDFSNAVVYLRQGHDLLAPGSNVETVEEINYVFAKALISTAQPAGDDCKTAVNAINQSINATPPGSKNMEEYRRVLAKASRCAPVSHGVPLRK